MYSAKGIKDVYLDRKDLRDSAVDEKYDQYKFLQIQIRDFYMKVNAMLLSKEKSSGFEKLTRLMEEIHRDYEARMKSIYQHSEKGTLMEMDISTLLNMSREVYSSSKAMLFSLKDYMLDSVSAENFENIPLSVR